LDRGNAAGHGFQAIIRGQWRKKEKLSKHVLQQLLPALSLTQEEKSKIMSGMRQETSGILKGFKVRYNIPKTF
jgi:hypothetical protein